MRDLPFASPSTPALRVWPGAEQTNTHIRASGIQTEEPMPEHSGYNKHPHEQARSPNVPKGREPQRLSTL